jgi:16S rRNA (cytosine967-C5)-methyltransferase
VTARAAAAELLVLVLDERRTLEEAFARGEAFGRLSGRDRAFAAAIARAALRHLGRIDAVLARFLARPLPESATRARAILRAGAAQLLFLKTPAHAAVSESVDAASQARDARGYAKLINAVLRKVAVLEAPPGAAIDDLPGWLRARWAAAYGAETSAAIAEAQAREPPLDLSVKADAEIWAARLGATLLATGSLRLATSEEVTALPGYAEGAWWVQDAAAALPAKLFGDVRGRSVLDLCAAPGGKTLQLAAAGGRVTALDVSGPRLARVRAHLKRTGLEAEIVEADVLAWRAPRQFDAIMLDAPCSATGTLRRHPEAAWLRTPQQIRGFAETQARMLAAAREWLKPDGRLVYAVCSLEPEEGAALIAQALRLGGWRREPITASLVGLGELVTAEGDLRTLPCHLAAQGGMDGFYAARLAPA